MFENWQVRQSPVSWIDQRSCIVVSKRKDMASAMATMAKKNDDYDISADFKKTIL